MRKFPGLVLLILLPLLGGCWNLQEVGDIAVAAGLGVDYIAPNQVEFTAQVVEPQPAQETGAAQVRPLAFSARGSTPSLAARHIMLSFPRVPQWAHASVYLLGEDLARHDLSLVTDHLAGSRTVRPHADLLIVKEGTARQALETRDLLSGGSARELQVLVRLQEVQRGTYVPVTISEFLLKASTPGVEPVIPQIKITTSNGQPVLRLEGLAVLKGNKMVGSLDEKEARGYRWLQPKYPKGGISITTHQQKSEYHVVVQISRFRSQTKVQMVDGKIKVRLKVYASANFLEQQGPAAPLNEERRRELEQAVSRSIASDIRAGINKSQQLNSDILGWGRLLYRTHPELWQRIRADWSRIYPTVEYQVQVQTTLDRTYLDRGAIPIR
mgnify:CR=1 FL=1|jgi:spore germination protein KC